jgi:HYR domain
MKTTQTILFLSSNDQAYRTSRERSFRRFQSSAWRLPIFLAAAGLACGIASGATLVVNSNADSGPGSLRQVIGIAANGDTITFSPAFATLNIDLLSQLVINKNLTINGPGADVAVIRSAQGTSHRIFSIQSGTVTITGLRLSGGVEDFSGDGGGGVLNLGTLTLRDCEISGNRAMFGGGIANFGSITIENSLVASNTALKTPTSPPSNIVTLENEVVGGGLYTEGTSVLRDSTFSGNTAVATGSPAKPRGGALFYFEIDSALAEGCTIVENSSVNQVGAFAWGGGYSQLGVVVPAFRNSILASNTLSFGTGGPGGPCGPDLCGGAISLGHNLVGIPFGSSFTDGVNGDQVGTATAPKDPQLTPLRDNGGRTRTHVPVPGSPALEAGDNASSPATDQRGLARIVNGTIDIGATESQTTCSPDVTVCAGSTVCSKVVNYTFPTVDPSFGPGATIFGFNPPNGSTFTLGTHPVNCLIVGSSGLQANCQFDVTVNDCTPPVFQAIAAQPNVLSPATGQLVPVKVGVAVSDQCGLQSTGVFKITANQPITANDFEITANLKIKLRAFKTPLLGARIYTIHVRCADNAGNATTNTTTVTVP